MRRRGDRVGRAATGAVVAEAHLAGGSVFMLAISPDNRTAAASSWANEVRLVDVDTLALTRRLSGTVAHVWGVDFTGDGSRIVGRIMPSQAGITAQSAVQDLIGAWLVDSDAALRDEQVHTDAVAATAGPAPGILTIVGSDGGIVEFDARKGVSRHLCAGPLRAIRIARAADWIAVGDTDGVLHLYRMTEGGAVAAWSTRVFPASVWALAASPDGTLVVCGDKGQSLAAVSAKDGAIRWTREIPVKESLTPPNRRFVSRLIFLDGGAVVTYAARISDAPRVLFDAADGTVLEGRSIGGGAEADDAVYRRTDGFIYSIGITGKFSIGGPGELDRLQPLARNGGVLCLDAAEERLFVATRDGSVRVVGFDPPLAIARFDGPNGMPLAIAFDDASDALTAVTNRGIARTWFGAVGAPWRASALPPLGELRVLRLWDGGAGR